MVSWHKFITSLFNKLSKVISVFANSECFEGFGFVRGWGRGGTRSYGGTTWIRLLQFLWSELTSFCWHSRYSASQLMALKFAPIKKYGATPLTAAYWPHSRLLSLSLCPPCLCCCAIPILGRPLRVSGAGPAEATWEMCRRPPPTARRSITYLGLALPGSVQHFFFSSLRDRRSQGEIWVLLLNIFTI